MLLELLCELIDAGIRSAKKRPYFGRKSRWYYEGIIKSAGAKLWFHMSWVQFLPHPLKFLSKKFSLAYVYLPICRLQYVLHTIRLKSKNNIKAIQKRKKYKLRTLPKKIILALQRSCTCVSVQLFIFLCKFVVRQAPFDRLQFFHKPPFSCFVFCYFICWR